MMHKLMTVSWWHFSSLKKLPWIPDLFLSDSRFGNG
jgi:hypothetical protein